ncbi:hypothetical protein SAMN05216243_3267 [Sediminibacillus albus]|uniref:Uncharacterized protein n=1 Tax=Sediminibacillus albus TaxID=407036 RepID=A0A1G9C5Y9_9BACI|nr:hypothetical protein SAMN05216243_3267 [Sediminibacillus albus]
MNWKLRIPLIIFLLGLISAIYQSNPSFFLIENYLFKSVQLFVTLFIVVYLFEKIGINKIKVHFLIGLLIICFGIAVDYFWLFL